MRAKRDELIMAGPGLRKSGELFARVTDRVLRVWLIVGAAVLAVSIGVAALSSAFGLLHLPYRLALVDERLPVIFRLHMGGSGLGLMLLPLVLLVRRRPRIHRPLGIATASAFAVGIAASLPSALASDAEPLARAGFFTQGMLALGCLVAGAWAGWRRRFNFHRTAMSCLAALVSGAIVLRLMLYAVIALRLPFEPSYTFIAWACWLLPLGLLWLATGMRRAGRRLSASVSPA